eukprot:6193570-Prymnesium_polylepis.2
MVAALRVAVTVAGATGTAGYSTLGSWRALGPFGPPSNADCCSSLFASRSATADRYPAGYDEEEHGLCPRRQRQRHGNRLPVGLGLRVNKARGVRRKRPTQACEERNSDWWRATWRTHARRTNRREAARALLRSLHLSQGPGLQVFEQRGFAAPRQLDD